MNALVAPASRTWKLPSFCREYLPKEDTIRRFASEGIRAFPVLKLEDGRDSAEWFHQWISEARSSRGAHGACLDVYSVFEYAKMHLFSDIAGMAGFALNGDEVVSVFSHRDRFYKRVSKLLMAVAVGRGGRFLNAFDTVLPKLYQQCGFVSVARLPWNDLLAPKDWDYQAMHAFNEGRPDLMFPWLTGLHLLALKLLKLSKRVSCCKDCQFARTFWRSSYEGD